MFFKDEPFSLLVPLFCFGVCTVYFSPFVLLSLPAPPPAYPLLPAHPLQPPLWLAWPRSADSAGTGNTLTLCPILGSPSKGQSKWDLQLHLKQSRYRREGQRPLTVSPRSPAFFFLEAYKVRGQGEMKLHRLWVAVSANFSLRGNERLMTFVCTGHI